MVDLMLDGKVALVTGASSGIGRAAAMLLAENGATVIVNHPGDERYKEVLSIVQRNSPASIAIQANVAKEDEVKQMFVEIKEKFGKLDILVNNAGILRRGLIAMTSSKDVDEVIDVNVKGVFYCLQYAAKIMMRQKSGKIVNTASIVGRYGDRGLSIYSASKGAVVALTMSAAKELGQFGITVNAVAPGIIDTSMTKNLDESVKNDLVSKTALKRIGTPEDVAKVILFLSSSLSDYVSGQILGVDGCQTI